MVKIQFLCKCFGQNSLIFNSYQDPLTSTGRFGITVINCTEFLRSTSSWPHSYVLRPAGPNGAFFQLSQGLAKSTETKANLPPTSSCPRKGVEVECPCLVPRVHTMSHLKVHWPTHCYLLEEIVQLTTVFILGRAVFFGFSQFGQDPVIKNYKFQQIACSTFFSAPSLGVTF